MTIRAICSLVITVQMYLLFVTVVVVLTVFMSHNFNTSVTQLHDVSHALNTSVTRLHDIPHALNTSVTRFHDIPHALNNFATRLHNTPHALNSMSQINYVQTTESFYVPERNIARQLLPTVSLHTSAYTQSADSFRARGNKEYARYIKDRSYVPSEGESVFIFGAVVRKTANLSSEVCNIYGHWNRNRSYANESVICCYVFVDGHVLNSSALYYGETWHNDRANVPLEPWFVTCPVPANSVRQIEMVSVVRGSVSCTHPSINYITPHYPVHQKPGYMVISTKTAHEKLDPNQIVAQFEAFRYLGVDKVVTYIEDSLWEPALKVFHYYASIGFLEMYSYEVAGMIQHPRKISEQTGQIYADQVTVMRDAIERNSGATYFGILDNDEFPIPSNSFLTLKEVLLYNDYRYPTAASFTFKNLHYFTDMPEPSCLNNCTLFQRYIHTAPGKLSLYHRKMICHPSRVYTGTLISHKALALPGYTPYVLSEDDVYIRHYGSCKRKFGEKVCNKKHKWKINTFMLSWANATIDNEIINAFKHISVL